MNDQKYPKIAVNLNQINENSHVDNGKINQYNEINTLHQSEKESESFFPKTDEKSSGNISLNLSRLLDNRLGAWVKSRFNKPAAAGLVYAGFWHRLLALFIDLPVSLSLSLALVAVIDLAVPPQIVQMNTIGANTLAMILFQLLYFVGFESSKWKATPGKRLLKLRVTDMRGQRLSPVKATIRTVLKLMDPFTVGVAIIWMFFSKKHQTLYDKFCRTLVLRKTNESFLPVKLEKWHWPIIISLSLVMSLVTFRMIIKIVTPRVDLVTLKIAINQTLKEIQPAQKSVEDFISKEGKFPAKIDRSLFSASKYVSYSYKSNNGSLTILFSAGKLNGMGLMLMPEMNKSTKEIVWSCAAINMPESLAPSNCATKPASR